MMFRGHGLDGEVRDEGEGEQRPAIEYIVVL
jgi:hypothetical protein